MQFKVKNSLYLSVALTKIDSEVLGTSDTEKTAAPVSLLPESMGSEVLETGVPGKTGNVPPLFSELTISLRRGFENVDPVRNETVTKNDKRHKVRGELEYAIGDTRRVIIANLEEVAEHSVYDPVFSNDESSRGWLDQNGWESRKTYVTDGETVYKAFLKIGKSRDGRNILYAVNCDVKDGVAVDMGATQKRAAILAATPFKKEIAQKPPAVKRRERDKRAGMENLFAITGMTAALEKSCASINTDLCRRRSTA